MTWNNGHTNVGATRGSERRRSERRSFIARLSRTRWSTPWRQKRSVIQDLFRARPIAKIASSMLGRTNPFMSTRGGSLNNANYASHLLPGYLKGRPTRRPSMSTGQSSGRRKSRRQRTGQRGTRWHASKGAASGILYGPQVRRPGR